MKNKKDHINHVIRANIRRKCLQVFLKQHRRQLYLDKNNRGNSPNVYWNKAFKQLSNDVLRESLAGRVHVSVDRPQCRLGKDLEDYVQDVTVALWRILKRRGEKCCHPRGFESSWRYLCRSLRHKAVDVFIDWDTDRIERELAVIQAADGALPLKDRVCRNQKPTPQAGPNVECGRNPPIPDSITGEETEKKIIASILLNDYDCVSLLTKLEDTFVKAHPRARNIHAEAWYFVMAINDASSQQMREHADCPDENPTETLVNERLHRYREKIHALIHREMGGVASSGNWSEGELLRIEALLALSMRRDVAPKRKKTAKAVSSGSESIRSEDGEK